LDHFPLKCGVVLAIFAEKSLRLADQGVVTVVVLLFFKSLY